MSHNGPGTAPRRWWPALRALLVPADRRESIRKHRSGEDSSESYNTPTLDKGGAGLDVEVQASGVQSDGEPVIAGTLPDVTEQRRMEEVLLESEAKYHALFECNPLPLFVYDRETHRILAVNEAAVQAYGYSRVEFLSMTIGDLQPPEDTPLLLETLKAAPSRLYDAGPFRHQKKDGSLINVRVTCHHLKLGDREAALALMFDVTEQLRAEQAMRGSRAQLAGIVDSAMDGIITVDENLRIVVLNPAAEKIFRCSAQKALGQTLDRFIPERFRSLHSEQMRAFAGGPEQRRRMNSREVLAGLRANGEEFPMGASISWFDADGKKFLTVVVRDLTEKVKAEESLRLGQQRLRQAVRASNIGIFEHNHCTDTVYWAPEMREIYGLGPDQPMTLQVYLNCVHPDDRKAVAAAVQRAHDPTGDGLFDVEHRIVRPDGSIRWVLYRSQTHFEGQGAARRKTVTIGATADITERKQAELALRESEADLKRAQAVAHIGSWYLDIVNDVLTWSEETYRMFGVALHAPLTLARFLETVHPDDREYVGQSWNAAVNGQPYDIEHRIIVGGATKWVRERAEVEFDAAGKAVRGIGTVQDVTERKQAELALRTAEEKYRSIFDHSPVGIFQSLPEGRYLSVNPAMASIYGYGSPEELMAAVTDLRHQMYVRPSDRDEFQRRIQERGVVRDFVMEMRRKDDSAVWVNASGRVQRDEQGRVLYYEGTVEDISERVEAEEMIARQARIIESSSEFIALASTAGEILYLNPAGRKLVGLGPDEDISRLQIDDFVFRDDVSQVADIVIGLLQGKSWEGESRFRHFVSGQPISVYQYAFAITNPATGEVSALANISHDVTEQKKLQAQFEQAQKLDALGRLAGGVAHDFNNLLAVITGYSELAMVRLEPAHPVMRSVSQIKHTAERAAALTKQLLAFGRQQVVFPRVVDLNSVLGKSLDILRRAVGEDIEVSLETGAQLGLVKVDPGQIDQIVMNLAVNARDAMPTGGEIVITTAYAEFDDHYAQEHVGTVPGPYVMLSVSDTGSGIDEKILPHIFDPFFTTKPVGKGTGLGLATVYGIVKQNHGHIWVYSEPDHGTTFKIYFPRVEEQAAGSERKADGMIRGGSETILLVEDEAVLREMTAILLEDKGYKVLTGGNGAAALALAETQSGKINLLLTDVIMPNMSGPELFAQLQKVRPEIRVLYMSGYAGDRLEHYGQIDPETELVEKPFARASLLKKVRAALDR